MKIKIKYNKRWYDVQKRIKKIPKLVSPIMLSFCKVDALTMVKEFHDGIKNKALGLEKLKAGTIRRKRTLGMDRPSTPLYGMGDEYKKNSYVNMLRIKKIKNGYRVYPSTAKHYSGAIKLSDLMKVHEGGTTITRGDTLINIPPRPAFLMAYKNTLKQRAKRLNVAKKEIKQAMRGYIDKGTIEQIAKSTERQLSGLMKYEKND